MPVPPIDPSRGGNHGAGGCLVKQILIIDDEEAVCWSLQRGLARQGYAVLTAGTAEQGLKLFAQHRPDAVILDVRLPGMDGLTALPAGCATCR